MLLRPATPLSVLLFIAFVLLLLSTLSTPVIKAIPLATYQNVDFGVFGYCKDSECSKAKIGYDTGRFCVWMNAHFASPVSWLSEITREHIWHQ
jgi:hypothetical protein